MWTRGIQIAIGVKKNRRGSYPLCLLLMFPLPSTCPCWDWPCAPCTALAWAKPLTGSRPDADLSSSFRSDQSRGRNGKSFQRFSDAIFGLLFSSWITRGARREPHQALLAFIDVPLWPLPFPSQIKVPLPFVLPARYIINSLTFLLVSFFKTNVLWRLIL